MAEDQPKKTQIEPQPRTLVVDADALAGQFYYLSVNAERLASDMHHCLKQCDLLINELHRMSTALEQATPQPQKEGAVDGGKK